MISDEHFQSLRDNFTKYEEQWNNVGGKILAAKGKVDTLRHAELLAAIGWILPEQISFNEVACLALGRDELTINHVNDFFID